MDTEAERRLGALCNNANAVLQCCKQDTSAGDPGYRAAPNLYVPDALAISTVGIVAELTLYTSVTSSKSTRSRRCL